MPVIATINCSKETVASTEFTVDSQATYESYLAVLWAKYQGQPKRIKSQIIDDLAAYLGILRDSASRLLRSPYLPRSKWGRCSPKRRRYSEECKKHLEDLWVGSGFMSSRHLKAALPAWLPHYRSGGLTAEIEEQLLAMSERTIEGFLKEKKAEIRRRQNSGTRRGVRKLVTLIPIKPLGHRVLLPGHLEVDLVAHCGESMSGEFVWTLTVTDVLTGWTECEAIWGKSGAAVRAALFEIEKRLPFPILSISFDNGTEFINDDVLEGFIKRPQRAQIIAVYRSRPYKKNDQCHVEQKNDHCVRQFMGYGRLDWKGSVGMMNSVYRGPWRLMQNFFRPQQKLVSKQRLFARVFRKMDAPETPLSRLQCHVSTDVYERLLKEIAGKNPFDLMSGVRRAIRSIYGYYGGRRATAGLWGRRVS